MKTGLGNTDLLEEICRNANLGKYRHFFAAERNKCYNNYLGMPIIIINITLGSIFFITLSKELPSAMKWAGALLALVAAISSGVQTFFNFNRQFEGHRNIGNRYLSVAYECQRVLSLFYDNLLNLTELPKFTESIITEYNEINKNAEVFPTTQKDFLNALHREEQRAAGLRERKSLLYIQGEENKLNDILKK